MAALESTTDSEPSAIAAMKPLKGRFVHVSRAIFPLTLVRLDSIKLGIEDFMRTLGLCNSTHGRLKGD